MTPIVLHHGLFGFGNVRVGPVAMRYFSGGIERAIREAGHPLIIARTHPTGGIALRARQLKEAILTQLAAMGRSGAPVAIVAHSMGGLDARYMIARLGMAGRVATLLTVCTPHRGSAYADWFVQNVGVRLGGGRLASALGLDVRAAVDLTTSSMSEFNRTVPDAPGVRYFSVSAACPAGQHAPLFAHSHPIVYRAEGENDGVVSLVSARWGEHLCTWPVDHLHAINKRLTPAALRPEGEMTPRYAALLENLRRRGALPGG